MYAISDGQIDIAQLLVQAGAQLNVINNVIIDCYMSSADYRIFYFSPVYLVGGNSFSDCV